MFEFAVFINITANLTIPLIGKDGDDGIDNITCEVKGTEVINTQT